MEVEIFFEQLALAFQHLQDAVFAQHSPPQKAETKVAQQAGVETARVGVGMKAAEAETNLARDWKLVVQANWSQQIVQIDLEQVQGKMQVAPPFQAPPESDMCEFQTCWSTPPNQMQEGLLERSPQLQTSCRQ